MDSRSNIQNMNARVKQSLRVFHYVELMAKACLIMERLVIACIILAIIGLVSGLFLSIPEMAIVLGLVIGGVYYDYAMPIGTIFCTIMLLTMIAVKFRYNLNLTIKKQLFVAIKSILLIQLPNIIIAITSMVA